MFMPSPIIAPTSAQAAGKGLQTVFVAGLISAVQCNLPGGANAVRITNRGPGDAFIAPQGNAALNLPLATIPAAGAPGGWPALANLPMDVQLPQGTLSLSVICSANASIYITQGQS